MDVFVGVFDTGAEDKIVQDALGVFEVAFGSNESTNGSAMKVVAISGKSQLKLVDLAVNIFSPSFRNGGVKSGLFFEFF